MPLELTYTPSVETSQESPSTLVLMVDEEAYMQRKRDRSFPIDQVVDSFEIFKLNMFLQLLYGLGTQDNMRSFVQSKMYRHLEITLHDCYGLFVNNTSVWSVVCQI